MLASLIHNAAVLLAMMVVFDLVTSQRAARDGIGLRALTGLSLGALCIFVMMGAVRVEDGILFDARSVLLSLSGLFFGAMPTVIAMAIASTYRLFLGGPGVWMGVLVIVATGGIGILWRRYRRSPLRDTSIRELYGFGVVVHLVMLSLVFTLPHEASGRVLAEIALPVLLVFPVATVVLGWLLAARLRREGATEALAASEARYRGLFEAANVGKAVMLSTGEFHVNRAFCDMLGYSSEELHGKTWQQLTPPEDIAAANARLAPLLRGEQDALRFEKRYVHRNGGHVWADVSAAIQRDQDGKPIYFIVTVVDITVQRGTAERLSASEERLRLATEQAQVAVWEYDCSSNSMVRSRNHDRLYGLEWQERWDLDTFLLATHPDDRGYSNRIIQDSVTPRGPDDYQFDFRVVFPDQSIRWLSVNGRVIARDERGQGLRVRGTLTDVTGAKQAEAALRESEERFRRAVFSAPYPIMIHAEDGEVVTINSPWTRLSGYEHGDIPTTDDWTRKAYGARRDVVRADNDGLYALDGPKVEGEYAITTSSGDTRIWDFSSAPIGRLPDGRRLVISMATDVTERKQVEETVRAGRDQLESIVATVPGIVCSFRLRPDGSACLPYGGERLAKSFGIPEARLAEDAAPFLALVHPDDLDDLMASIRESARRSLPFRREWRVRAPAHRERWMEVHSVPSREPDGSTLWHGVATDITERKQSEADLTLQLAELQRWHDATLGREHRVRELKREVNALLDNAGLPPRYTAVSQADDDE